MDIINELRMLAEDFHSTNGTNRYSSAMSTAADEIVRLRAIPEHWQDAAKLITEQDNNPSTREEARGKAVMLLKILLIEDGIQK